MPEHAVIVRFTYGKADLKPLYDLEDKLQGAIEEAPVGEYDGHEIAVDGSDGTIYMYGPDADALFSVVAPVLRSVPFACGAKVIKRYGAPEDGVREECVTV